jgi:Uma2 family endonuclease
MRRSDASIPRAATGYIRRMADEWRKAMPGTTAARPQRHRLSVNDYYRMGDVGILPPDERVELIDGEIIDMPPPGSLHAGTVDQLAAILLRALGEKALVRVQNPARLDHYSEPQPDLALLRPRSDHYKSAHPLASDLLLVVEVADTSLRYDRDVKTALYAQHGIPEVWLIDVRDKRLVRYRNPAEGIYASVDEPDLSASIEVSAIPGVRADLGAVFRD